MDGPEAIKAQVDQVEVLPDDLRAGPAEVQRVRLLGATEVVQLKDW